MDSLRRKKRNQFLAILAAVSALAALIAVNVLRPSPEDEVANTFADTVLNRDPGQWTEDERRELRNQWEQFSPETREAVFTEIARARLEEMRERTRGLSPEQRATRIQEAISQMRARRRQLSPERKARVQERMASPEGQEMVRNVLEFYQTELTAKERAEMDPLVREWFRSMEEDLR